MPSVHWIDNENTILEIEYDRDFSLENAFAARAEAANLIAAQGIRYPVGLIINMLAVKRLPGELLKKSETLAAAGPSNIECSVLVTANATLRSYMNLAVRFRAGTLSAGSRQEAVEIIKAQRKRASV